MRLREETMMMVMMLVIILMLAMMRARASIRGRTRARVKKTSRLHVFIAIRSPSCVVDKISTWLSDSGRTL